MQTHPLYPESRAKGVGRFLLSSVLFFSFLSSPATVQARELKILTSFLPIYIFTKNVVGERAGVKVECLLPGDAEPHSYHIRPSDMRRVAGADLLIINGLGIEEFIVKIQERSRSKTIVFDSSKGLPLITAKGDGHSHSHGHDSDVNPHVWVSPKMAALQVNNISHFLSEIDPEGEAAYRANAAAYIDRLEEIWKDMTETVNLMANRKVVTFHGAFDYLARDIGLDLIGVIFETPGEEPSAGDIIKLIALMKREGVKVVFAEPQFPARMAEVIAEETGAKIYVLDAVATGRFEDDYYRNVMLKNLQVLGDAIAWKEKR